MFALHLTGGSAAGSHTDNSSFTAHFQVADVLWSVSSNVGVCAVYDSLNVLTRRLGPSVTLNLFM